MNGSVLLGAQSCNADPTTSIIVAVEVEGGTLHFTPERTIKVGDTIKWINLTDQEHTVSPLTASDKIIGTQGLAKENSTSDKDEYSEVFSTAGSIHYHCEIHPEMTGTITVSP